MNNKNQLYKSIALLFLIVIGCAIIIRYISKGENLYDYANNNNIPIHTESVDK